MKLVHQFLQESGRRHPDKIAVICNDDRLSYSELLERIETTAGRAIVEGLQKGDRVLIVLRDRVECLLACLSVIHAGGIAVPISGSGAAASIESIARECAPFMCITGNGELADIPVLRDKLTCRLSIFNPLSGSLPAAPAGAGSSFATGEPNYADRIIQLMDLTEDDGAILLYGRGSEGELNGALFSHRNVAQTSCNIDSLTMTDASTNEFVLLALEESIGFMRICSLLFAGSTVVLDDGSRDEAAVAQRMLKEQCTSLSADVTTFGSFIDNDQSPLRNPGIHLTSVHLGGTAVPFLFKKRKLIHDFPNAHIYLHFGTAEAPFTTCIEVNREKEKLDSIGQPTPHTEISIIDDKGQTISREEIGEIMVRGDQVMQQYWRRIELNRQVFHGGGWLRSGIIGYCDKDGYVHFLGPKSEIINTPGHVVFPFEVEEAIHEYYPDCEICVVGVPDPSVQAGDILILCYRSNNGQSIIPAELLSALAYRLDKGKIPRIVYRMDDMPRSKDTFGRQELRRRIVEGVAASTPNAP